MRYYWEGIRMKYRYEVKGKVNVVEEATRNFRELEVWKKAHKFTLEIYRMITALPNDEKFGISSQIKRSSVSVPANIVEGYKRFGTAEKKDF
jgi:hypothetical protein